MKKTPIITLALSSFVLLSCASRKQSDVSDVTSYSTATPHQSSTAASATIQKITFSTSARGYSKSIVLTPDSINTSIRSMRGPEPMVHRQLNVKEWSGLVTSLGGLSISEIPKLESPTHGRETDAAQGSIITIFTSDKKQYEHYFDDTNPNEKLKPLMDAIFETEKSKTVK